MVYEGLIMVAAASLIGSTLGSLGSSFISNAASGKAQRRAYQYARELQQQQYNLSIQGYKEGPSAQRSGLEAAGYNPMLALGNVGNGVSVAGGTPVNANATDVSGIRDAMSTAANIKNQTAQTEAITDAQYADADLKKAQKASLIERLPYVSKQAKADYMKTTMESAKLENDIHYQNEYLNYLGSSLSNAKEIAQIQAEASKYGANKAFQGAVYNADTAADSTPFRYVSKRINSSNVRKGVKDIYDFYNRTNRFIYGAGRQ